VKNPGFGTNLTGWNMMGFGTGITLTRVSATSQLTLSPSWQQVSVGYTVTAPSSRSLDFNAYLSSADALPGTCFYADDASITVPWTLERR
jgi:hypothetical protein